MTFNELNLRKPLLDSLAKASYKKPSPIQEKGIPILLEGSDLIACAQTGTGKTATFALPILNSLSFPVIKRKESFYPSIDFNTNEGISDTNF